MRKSTGALFALMLAGTGLSSAPAQAAQPVLKGSWEIALCNNPDRLCSAALCAQFTRIPGHVDQMPNSGSFALPGFSPTFVGKWIQHGDLVHFYGSYNFSFITFTGLLNGAARMGGLSFSDGPGLNPANVDTGTWHARKVNACPAGPAANGLPSEPN